MKHCKCYQFDISNENTKIRVFMNNIKGTIQLVERAENGGNGSLLDEININYCPYCGLILRKKKHQIKPHKHTLTSFEKSIYNNVHENK